MTAAEFLSRYLSGPLPHVRHHITVLSAPLKKQQQTNKQTNKQNTSFLHRSKYPAMGGVGGGGGGGVGVVLLYTRRYPPITSCINRQSVYAYVFDRTELDSGGPQVIQLYEMRSITY